MTTFSEDKHPRGHHTNAGAFSEKTRSEPEIALSQTEEFAESEATAVLSRAEVRSSYAWGDVPSEAQGEQAESDFDEWLDAERADAVAQHIHSEHEDAVVLASDGNLGDLIEYEERGFTRRGINNGDGTASHFTTRNGRRAVNVLTFPEDAVVVGRAGDADTVGLANDLRGAGGAQNVGHALQAAATASDAEEESE